METPLPKIWATLVAKKNTSAITVFFVLFAGLMAALFVFQMFFANQNFNTMPIYGSVGPSQPLTSEQIQQAINTFIFQTVFFSESPLPVFYKFAFPTSLNLSSSYLGTVISNADGFDFAPAVMKEGNTYKMWWCGLSPKNSTDVFSIYYAESNDSVQWSSRQVVLRPTKDSFDALYVCQPSVVKVNSTYYMYYTGVSLNITNVSINAQGSIFLATSNDGINWSKYSSNSNPQPVIIPPEGTFNFVNQPSILYYNNKFYLYFTNSTSGNGTDTSLATSDDGIHFNVQNDANPVFTSPVGSDRDVKFLNSAGFFMVYGSIDTNKIFWTNSSDGTKWLLHDNSRTIQTKKYCNFGPGLLSYANGTSDLSTIVYYGAGDTTDNTTIGGCVNPKSWTIDASSFNITISNITTQVFNATNLKCISIRNGFHCKFDYLNSMNESAIVLFMLTDAGGNVLTTSIPIAQQGILQAGSLMMCTQFSGNAYVSWKVYRMSDISLTNVIAWSKTTERQNINCGV